MQFSKKRLICLLQAAVSFGIVYYLFRLIDWRPLEKMLSSGEIFALWPGPLILLIGLMIASDRWRTLIAFFGVHLRRVDAFKLYLIGCFYSVLLPGVLSGDVVRAAMCRVKTGGPATAVLASVGIERGLGLWGLTLVGTIGALAVALYMPVNFDFATLWLSPLMAVGVPCAVYISYFATKIFTKVGHGVIAKFLEKLRLFSKQIGKLPVGLAMRTLIFSTAFQFSEIIIYFYFGHVVNIDMPFIFYLFVVPLIYFATVLPISLGGIGVREGVLVSFLSVSGVSTSDAVLLAFLIYLNRVLIAIVGGFVHAGYKFYK